MPSEKHEGGSNAPRSSMGSHRASEARARTVAPSGATHHATPRVRELCQVIPATGYDKPPGACVAAMHPCYRPLDLGICNPVNSNNGLSRMYNPESIANTRAFQTTMKPEDYSGLSEGDQRALVTANWARNHSSDLRSPGRAPPPPPPPPPSASVKVTRPPPSVREVAAPPPPPPPPPSLARSARAAVAPPQPPPPPPRVPNSVHGAGPPPPPPPPSGLRSTHAAAPPPPPPPPPLLATGQVGRTPSQIPLPKSTVLSKASSKDPVAAPVHKVEFISPGSRVSAPRSRAPTLTPSDSISNRSAPRTKIETVKAALTKGASLVKSSRGNDASCELCRRGSNIPQVDGARICSGCVQSHRFLVAQSSGNRH